MEYHYHPLPYDYEKPPPQASTIDNYYYHHNPAPPPPPPATADPYYLHQHHLPPPSLAAEPYYVPPPPAPQPQMIAAPSPDIHTIFISGLPEDVKAREIHNLFLRRPGFDTCLLEYTGRGNQVVAYATFFSHQSAVSAMAELNGVIFDAETGATLNIELARSNSRRQRRGDGAYDIIDKRTWSSDGEKCRLDITKDTVTTTDSTAHLHMFRTFARSGKGGSDEPSGGSDEPSGTENDNTSKMGAASQSKRKADAALGAREGQSEYPSSDDVSPCSTLFIANLGSSCTKAKLKQMFSECRGFQKLKMCKKYGKPVAFADFWNVESSTECKEKFLGTSKLAADDAGLHLEYARAKMRKPWENLRKT